MTRSSVVSLYYGEYGGQGEWREGAERWKRVEIGVNGEGRR